MTDATDETARRERAIALMREALALLEAHGQAQAQAATHLRDAISAALALARPASGKTITNEPALTVEGLHRASPARAADAPRQERDSPKPKR